MAVDKRFKKGIELFNQEAFFECHEMIEDLWLETRGKYRDLLKSSTRYLSAYKPRSLGLNVEKLIEDMKLCFDLHQKGKMAFPKLELPSLRSIDLKRR